MNPTIIIPLLVAIVAAVGAYFAAVRKLSGTITTSTAEDLWTESRQMRKELSDRIIQLNIVVDSMQDRIDKLLTENSRLEAEIDRLKKSIASLEASS